jgi:hypothetical protein
MSDEATPLLPSNKESAKLSNVSDATIDPQGFGSQVHETPIPNASPPDLNSAGERTPGGERHHMVPQPNILTAATDLLDKIDPEVSNNFREVGWRVLERFSRVTRASRETASMHTFLFSLS